MSGERSTLVGTPVVVAPGKIFTLGDNYGNCLRLNAAFWSERTEQALETLGGLAETMSFI